MHCQALAFCTLYLHDSDEACHEAAHETETNITGKRMPRLPCELPVPAPPALLVRLCTPPDAHKQRLMPNHALVHANTLSCNSALPTAWAVLKHVEHRQPGRAWPLPAHSYKSVALPTITRLLDWAAEPAWLFKAMLCPQTTSMREAGSGAQSWLAHMPLCLQLLGTAETGSAGDT